MKKVVFAASTLAALTFGAAGVAEPFGSYAFDAGRALTANTGAIAAFNDGGIYGLSFGSEDDYIEWKKRHSFWYDGTAYWDIFKDLPDYCIYAKCIPDWWFMTEIPAGLGLDASGYTPLGLFPIGTDPSIFPPELLPYI